MYLLLPFTLQNFKRTFRADAAGQKWPICPEQFFSGTKHYYYFHLPVGPYHCAKFTKNSYGRSKVMRMHHFWAQNGPFAQNNFFSENYITFI